jgi:hypothetical protein
VGGDAAARLCGTFWIEQQKDTVPAAEKDVPPVEFGDQFQAKHLAVKFLGCLQVIYVHARL